MRVNAVARSSGGVRPEVSWDVRSLSVASQQDRRASVSPGAAPQLGNKPYAVLLCKFPDVGGEPTNVATLTAVQSGVYPGMDHYWREVSANQMNVAGTQVFGWFTLPQPKATYMNGASPRLSELAVACAAAADPQVDFSRFFGIQTQFNSNLTGDDSPGSAWGGGSFLTLDGPGRGWPVTWMPLWATDIGLYSVFAHEMGHSLGLPHSTGPYTETYDSSWDVMSNSYLGRFGNFLVPGHTITPHKNDLGWIPSQRRRVVTVEETFTLDRSAFPPGGSNPLMAEVAIPGSPTRYVIEARRLLGYDQNLPGEGVIIHRVGAICPICSTVVDADGNGNPNDAGAMWTAGETFIGEGGVRVAINFRTQDGWNITVSPNVINSQCSLTLNQTAGGTVSLTSGAATGPCGRSITVNAVASASHVFRGWSNGNSTAAMTLTLNQSLTLSASFVRQCSFTLVQTAGGSVALSSGAVDGDCGRSTTVAATSATDFLFRAWSNGTTSNPYTFSLDETTTLSATFVRQCALALVQTAGGSIALTEGVLAGDCGRSVLVSAAPTGGNAFLEWSDGGATTPRTLTVTDVSQSLSATFSDVNGMAARLVAALLASPSTGPSAAETRYLDKNGNANGSADLGDLLALLDRFPGAQVNANMLNKLLQSEAARARSSGSAVDSTSREKK